MSLGPDIIKILSRQYEPSQMIERKFRGYHIAFKTDEKGNPVLLFIGTRNGDGTIKGRRYARRLVTDKAGVVIKDHWDDKGKTN